MLKFSSIIFFIALLISSCKKYNNNSNDLEGDLYLRGRTFVFSTLIDSSIIAVSGKQVKLGYTRDNTRNYLFNTTADSLGYFLFENLRKDTLYSVFGEYEKDGIKYYARLDTSLSKSIDSSYLIFKPDELNQNGVAYTVVDARGGLISNANICLFTSYIIANDSCAGSTFPLLTNSFGKASRLNVPAGDYIAFIKAKFGNLTLTAKDTIRGLGATGIVRRWITVK